MKLLLFSVVALCLLAGFGCSTERGARQASVGGSTMSEIEGAVHGQGTSVDYRQVLADPGKF